MLSLPCIEPADWLADLIPIEVSLILITAVVVVIIILETPWRK